MQTPQHTSQQPSQHLGFDYTVLDEETRHFVYQKTVETQGYLKRTAEDVIQIGRNLHAVKERLPYGQFMAWVKGELGLTRQSCQNFMRVAERFGENVHLFGAIPISVLYELLNAPEDVLKQIEEQEIAPTLPAVRAAKEQARQETITEGHVMMASTPEQAPDHDELLQLRRQIETLEQERFQLRQDIASHQQKEQEAPFLPAHVQQHIQTLEQHVKELSTQRDMLSRHLASVSEQARESVLERNALSHEQQTRLRWREIATEFLRSGGMLLSSMPSPMMLDTFEAEDWTRLEQIEQVLTPLLQAVNQIHSHSSSTIEAG
ncbi:hypothetical protein KSC_044620 [Ktedonobacter sp. SOSP1-52]|uniref:DUF3102 domain-containing protein n=1 Tax=Ktedonobacter sp. SOSP1-52 TaxID=2778366 RepID=UPI0019163749|nr:DUF3102 domain-containing protein [Ktedonobacter sp. SOSP1-52]GHO65570.1 hypothetical protein KSC_044620 [Ktedonobacter sp. SOSP1-52]